VAATAPRGARRSAGAVLALSVLLVLPGCSGAPGAGSGAAPSASPTGSGSTEAPQPSEGASPGPTPTAVPQQVTAADGSVPARERPTLSPPAQGEPVDVAAGGGEVLGVALEGVRAVEVAADGPGEVSGPGIALTVSVRNGNGGPLSLAGLVVTADSGQDAVPAVAADGGDPLPASLAAGELGRGTYVFLLGDSGAESVRALVTLSADLPIVALRGAITP